MTVFKTTPDNKILDKIISKGYFVQILIQTCLSNLSEFFEDFFFDKKHENLPPAVHWNVGPQVPCARNIKLCIRNSRKFRMAVCPIPSYSF